MCHKLLLPIVLNILLFCYNVKSIENNVCPSFRDYFNMRNNTNCWYNFAADAKVPDIIKQSGYPFMEYKVRTKDDYILTVFRIPSVRPHRSPVFMLHGVQSTSGIFVSLGRESIAFLLADAGYDVWLGNYRGTEYSEGHMHLNVTQREYWNYGFQKKLSKAFQPFTHIPPGLSDMCMTFYVDDNIKYNKVDEIALIDVPAMLGLVNYHTAYRGKIIYIGHSLGTTAAMMYASEYPEHAKNMIKLFIWVSPAYKLTHMRSPYRTLFPLMRSALQLTNTLNVVQVISRGHSRNLTRPTCLASPALMLVCLNMVNLFLGPFTQIAPETIPVYFNQLPGGTSLKTLTYLSEAVKGRFRKYDYGGGRNRFLYGSSDPPEYDITKIKVPVFVFYAAHDWCTTKEDSLLMYNTLPKPIRVGMYEVPNINFNHYDFFFGRNAKTLFYDKLFIVLDRFDKDPKWTE